jgi:hypothetical protein
MIRVPECKLRQCKHFIGVVQDNAVESTERVVCRAFPNGIPASIAYGDDRHLTPVEGDHGIQYERQ